MKLLSAIAMSAILGFSSLAAANYSVDTSHSHVGFKVRHMMVEYVRGEFTDFKGHYDYDAKKKHINALEGSVQVASVDTGDVKRDNHLRSGDFFDAKKHPNMNVKLLSHKGDKALIALTMKGVTKNVSFEVEDLSGESKDPWGNVKTGFTLNGKISRKAYNILFNKILETGGVAVGDEVKIYLEIGGNRVK